MIKFKGKEVIVPGIGTKWIPTAIVSIIVNKKFFTCDMLVDSGADISLIPRKFGEQLDFSFHQSELKEIRGIGEGAVPYVLRKVKIQIGKLVFPARIGWALIEEVPFILGRLDIFDIFNIEFKQKTKTTIFRKA